MAKILLVHLSGSDDCLGMGLAKWVLDTPDLRDKIGRHYNARRKAAKQQTECPHTELLDLFWCQSGLRKGVFNLSQQFVELNNIDVLLVDLECPDYTPMWKREGFKSLAAYNKALAEAELEYGDE